MNRIAKLLLLASSATAQPSYDLLLKGGHVIDAKNRINGVRDVAISAGRIALVGIWREPWDSPRRTRSIFNPGNSAFRKSRAGSGSRPL